MICLIYFTSYIFYILSEIDAVHCTTYYTVLDCKTLQSTKQCSAVQCSAVQCRAVQCSAVDEWEGVCGVTPKVKLSHICLSSADSEVVLLELS